MARFNAARKKDHHEATRSHRFLEGRFVEPVAVHNVHHLLAVFALELLPKNGGIFVLLFFKVSFCVSLKRVGCSSCCKCMETAEFAVLFIVHRSHRECREARKMSDIMSYNGAAVLAMKGKELRCHRLVIFLPRL